jgi:hypothetical protein
MRVKYVKGPKSTGSETDFRFALDKCGFAIYNSSQIRGSKTPLG